MSLRTTYTFVELALSPAAFEEIQAKLTTAEYEHAFEYDKQRKVFRIDMHGLAVTREED